MQIRVLGPVTVDGRAVVGPRLAALVHALVLAHGHVVPVGDLLEAVWDADLPAAPGAALQALMSRARRLGLCATASNGGYRLVLDGAEIDLVTAHDLRGRARTARSAGDFDRASVLAREALELWPPDGRARMTGPTARVYRDLLTLHVEARITACDALDDDTLDLVRAAVGELPTDEPLTDLLMRALAANGRAAEAMAVFERLRRALVRTYGTDPGDAVARTHGTLVRGGCAGRPAPATAAPRWRRPTTAMLGRDADVLGVERALSRHPVVTIVAVGGAGKTRLAIDVARRATERGEAVHAIELAGVRDPAQVMATLLRVVGTSATTTPTGTDGLQHARDQVARAVTDLDGLLVLDNCEHLLDAVAEVIGCVLESARPGLRVLATSRAPLGVVGEAVHAVTTLPDDVALALLELRARALRPDLAWDVSTARALCRRLDNLPLAIELAAARLCSMPLAEVLAGVTDRFALLDDALRGLPDRHRGLWAMVDWSWALLDADRRRLLCDLAVIPAPFTAAAAVAVAGAADDDDRARAETLRGLAILVDQSLVGLEEPADGRPPRYRMLETVREYGEARLAAAASREVPMDRLVRWAARTARSRRADLVGAGQLGALRAAGEDEVTFVAALRWAVDRPSEHDAFAVAAELVHQWTMRGLHVTVVTWARRLLRVPPPGPGRPTTGPRRGSRPDATDLAARPTDRAAPDDVAAVVVATAYCAAIVRDVRVGALAVRWARWCVAAEGERLSPRARALVRATSRTAHAADEADPLAADADPYVRGVGLLVRASRRERDGDPSGSGADARAALAAFESIGDHWGMGLAAQAVGRWEIGRRGTGADEWLTRAGRHLDLVGAGQDAREILVLRDLRRAVNGSAAAADALAHVAASPTAAATERAFAELGLGVLASARSDWRAALAHADAGVRVARDDPGAAPQGRVLTEIEVAAALVRIRGGAAAAPLLAAAVGRAVELMTMPVLGWVALGCSELAASRDEPALADELWALGMRVGAHLSTAFGCFEAIPRGLLPAVDQDARAARLTAAEQCGVADVAARLTALMTATHPPDPVTSGAVTTAPVASEPVTSAAASAC